MRNLFLTLFLCLFSILFAFSQRSGILVQVAAFDTEVPLSYFKGLSNIFHFEDHNNIHKYYLSGFSNKATAAVAAKNAKSLGYNAYVVDMDQIKNTCAVSCGMSIDPAKARSIFFDFDKSRLRSESRRQLDLLYIILTQHPEYSAELSAHTDAKGSPEYNKSLSERRANAAKDYLLSKGISASRLKVSTFGENSPIAKNQLDNGRDTEAGRQYNRRVELIVFNPNGKVAPVVEEIVVPESLRQ